MRRLITRLVFLLALVPVTVSAQSDTTKVLAALDAKSPAYEKVARQIWEFAEVGYQEAKSSVLLQDQLRAAGFAIEAGVAEIPTAFVAAWGSGSPVIAFIGEFDALPGLSQDAVPSPKPLVAGGPGHGCGHHVLGTAAAAAAIAARDWLAASGRPGTVKFFGAPAEEGGGGKVYMVRAGLFRDVDVAVTWHPGDGNHVTRATSLANVTAKFRFRGKSAHAAAAPEQGRSALDGVEAMNAMVNLMREHVPAETRIHYIITNGGRAPNVVPDFAEVYYYARHSDMRLLDGIWERIRNASKGAALGTGTEVEEEVVNAVYNTLPNDALADVMQKALDRVGGVRYTPEEAQFAAEVKKTLSGAIPPAGTEAKVLPAEAGVASISTDVGDVSWVVPTVQLSAATWVPGTPAHSWQAVAAGGMSIGTKGMMVAAKAMALTAIELYATPSEIARAKAEFATRVGDFRYVSKVGDRKPPLDYRK